MNTSQKFSNNNSELRIANIRLNVLPVFLASNVSNKKRKRGRGCRWYKFPLFLCTF